MCSFKRRELEVSTNVSNISSSDKVYYIKLFTWGVFFIYIIAPALSTVLSYILNIQHPIASSLYFVLAPSYRDVVLPSFYVLIGITTLALVNLVNQERTKPFSRKFPGKDFFVTVPGWISLWALIIITFTLLRAIALPFYTENQVIISQVTTLPGVILLLVNIILHTVMVALSYKTWHVFQK